MTHARTTSSRRRGLLAFCATTLVAVAATAQVVGGQNLSLREQLEACRSGATYQTREACIAETRAAYAARQRGGIQTYGDHAAHALARCNIYRVDEERLACRARVMGLGEVSGSVAGGGLLRRYEYLVPAEPDARRGPAADPRSMGAAPSPGAAVREIEPLQPILPLSPAFPMYPK